MFWGAAPAPENGCAGTSVTACQTEAKVVASTSTVKGNRELRQHAPRPACAALPSPRAPSQPPLASTHAGKPR